MPDQAAELRLLARRVVADEGSAHERPRVVTFCSGKSGQGVTTMSVNYALALAERGRRVIVIDAALERSAVAKMLNLRPTATIDDLLTGERSIHEVLLRGPCGIQVLPGTAHARRVPDGSPAGIARLAREVGRLGRFADVVVLDAGSGATPVMRALWRLSDLVMTVIAPQSLALMDAYALIKWLSSTAPQATLACFVNKAPDAETSERIAGKVREAAASFCGTEVEAWPGIPEDSAVTACDAVRTPWWFESPTGPAALALDRLATLSEMVPQRRAKAG
ncbi:MAG: AAA family ATPase [Pirellulales bacterium]